ncbi:MAG: RNA polymerase factor sigma-32 [Desulfobacterales bacterium]|jgi:RNA polymerase sigma-32 factor
MLSHKKTVLEDKQNPQTRNLPGNGKRNRRKAAPGFSSRPTPKAERSVVPNTLQNYLTSISQYKLLSRDEEQILFKRLNAQGDSRAAHKLVTSNLRLVVKIALDYRRIWMQNLLDLIQEGNLGLMKAVEKFDPNKKVKFSYYASFWIKAYIIKHLMDNFRLVKIGTTQAQRKLFFRLKKEKQKLRDEGVEPRAELISDRLGVSKKEVVEMDQRINGWDISLDAPLTDDTDAARIEFLKTSSEPLEDKISKKEFETILHQRIAEFKKEMNQRELDIFNQRIFAEDPETLAEIGKRYGISRERVRQIQKNIIAKMKESFKHALPDYAAYSEGGYGN